MKAMRVDSRPQPTGLMTSLNATHLLDIDYREQGRIRLSGELDLCSALEHREALGPRIASGGDLVFDLADVTFIDCAGLRCLLLAAHRLEGRGRVVFESPSSQVSLVLNVVHAERFANVVIEPGTSRTPERVSSVRQL